MRDQFLKPVLTSDREDAVNVHKIFAGHWGLAHSSLHRIGHHPTRNCQQCGDLWCPAALSEVCRKEANMPTDVPLSFPARRANVCACLGPSIQTQHSSKMAGP